MAIKLNNETYKLTEGGNLGKISLTIGIVGLALSLLGYFMDSKQFFHSYLTAFMFWTSIGLGGLFFVMIHHLTSATWSIVLRRLFENIMCALPVMAVLALPIIAGIGDLYHWSHHDAVASDHLLQDKAPYLNTTFFIIRMVGYFLIWFVLARLLYKTSLEQDTGSNKAHIAKMRKISAPGIILFAFTLTFASFDWLMSLDAHWYSTIFGAYVFAGGVVSMFSFTVLFVMYFKRNGILGKEVTVEHYHDLGKLIFTFVVFWGYMAFSQYFLIWYGNIPEETVWFLHRWQGSWKIFTLLIVFGHFGVPFFGLFPQDAKKNKIVLTTMALWVLLMHWVDLYWLVMPSLYHEGAHLSWMDLTTMLGVGGVYVWVFWRKVISQPLLPVNDPRLRNSMNFVNH